MMAPFLWMISTSLKTRAEVFADAADAASDRSRGGRTTRTCGTRCRSRSFFVNSVKLATLNTVGQLISCSMAAFAFAALRFRFREPLFAPPPGDADHPVPGRPRPELHPLPAPAAPIQHERQLDRHAGAAVGRRVPRRRVRDVPAPPVLPGDPARARPTPRASTGRIRGRSTATSTCRWPSPPSRRSRSSRSCGPGTT